MKNVLFVGGSGLLGRMWLKKLNNSIRVFATVNKNKIEIKRRKLKILKLNIFDKNQLDEFIKKNNIDVIINVAGLTSIEKCEMNKKEAIRINVNIPEKLKNIAEKNNIKIIHLSTDHIFSGKKKGYYEENSKPSPLNFYSKTKFMAENKIKKYKKSLIIRTNFFGGITKNRKSFSEYILYNIKKKKYIYLWNNIFFTPVSINFLINIIHKLINKNIYGVINIASNDKISKFDFGLQLCAYFKINKKYILKKENDKNSVIRPRNMSLSNKKLLKIFPNLKRELFLKNQIKHMYK